MFFGDVSIGDFVLLWFNVFSVSIYKMSFKRRYRNPDKNYKSEIRFAVRLSDCWQVTIATQ